MQDYRKKVVKWFAKINFLKGQIEKLEKLKDAPIISISVFLLKSQLVEFELRQTVFTLDLHLNEYFPPKTLKRHIRTPNEFDGHTLRKLLFEVNQFEWKALDELKRQFS